MTYSPKHPTLKTAKAAVVAGQAAGGTKQRARLLAYAYLRGRSYRSAENRCACDPNQPDETRNDLYGSCYTAHCTRRLAAAYVECWNKGEAEPELQYGTPVTDDKALQERLSTWARVPTGGHATKAVVRCPDLPEVNGSGVETVGSEAPAAGDEQGAPVVDGLLAQVRQWIG